LTAEVPTYQVFMLPTLKAVGDGQPHPTRDVAEAAANALHVSDEARAVRISSGGPAYLNKAFWAQSYLFQAGLLERPRRGVIQISTRGKELLADPPAVLNSKYLERYESFLSFRERSRPAASKESAATAIDAEASPEELIDQAIATNRASVGSELLAQIQALAPDEFERLVLRVLVALGYGTDETAVHAGKSGDEGIDGIIYRDALGLDRVYMQAKRYIETTVGPESINAFYGALQRKGADRGVFITSGSFTAGARRAEVDFRNIVLVDGLELADLMIAHDVGVEVTTVYRLKRVNEDFFEDI
jgi:restriction system protein